MLRLRLLGLRVLRLGTLLLRLGLLVVGLLRLGMVWFFALPLVLRIGRARDSEKQTKNGCAGNSNYLHRFASSGSTPKLNSEGAISVYRLAAAFLMVKTAQRRTK